LACSCDILWLSGQWLGIWRDIRNMIRVFLNLDELELYNLNLHQIAWSICSYLTFRKIAIWMSNNCQKLHFFQKNWQKLSLFFLNDNFWQFFYIEMAIFRRVRFPSVLVMFWLDNKTVLYRNLEIKLTVILQYMSKMWGIESM